MAGKGKGALRIAIEDFLETFTLGKIFLKWFTEFGEDQEVEIADFNRDLMDMIKNVPNLPEGLRKIASLRKGDQAQGGILSMGGFAGQMGMSMAGGILQPIVNTLNYTMDFIIGSARQDIQTMLEAEQRGFLDPHHREDLGRQIGWDKETQQVWIDLSNRLMGPGDLINLWRRKEIGEIELDTRLKEQFFDDKTISELKVITEIIPGVGDLINMMVREAFNDEVASRFGYDEDFPSDILPFTRAQGLTDEWVTRYWRAHWSLPGIGQAFEMLHRLRPKTTDHPFTIDDLNELLKIQDVPSYWRSRLTEVSYAPLTRVDVRRMHDLGTLDVEGVKGAYLDAGYNEVNADLMTDFTIKFNEEPIKLLSKQTVLKAFKRGLFTEVEALDILIQSGWDSQQAQFYIDIAHFDMLEKETDLQTDLQHDLYIAGEISKSQVHSNLNTLNIPDTQTERLLKEWELEKLKKVRLPTESELENWYKLDYITDIDYMNGLIARNYKLETVDLYIRQADQDIADLLQKQERDLLEAKEKLERDDLSTSYRIKQAGFNVLIAQEKSSIAELKVIAHDIVEKEVLDEIKKTISLIQLKIKDLQLEKARFKLEEEEET